jgi:hypothetical protein
MDSAVDIVTGYGMGGVVVPAGARSSHLHFAHTGARPKSVSYAMGTVVKAAEEWNSLTHLQLVPRSSTRGSINPLRIA